MSIEVQATYEDGVLKLDKPLPFDEHERVVIQVTSIYNLIWKQSGGGLKWLGTHEELREFAEGTELRHGEDPEG